MKGRGPDWGFIAPLAIAIVFIVGIFGVVAWAIESRNAEPTSRCLDAEFRIFERDGYFSVAPDPDCAK